MIIMENGIMNNPISVKNVTMLVTANTTVPMVTTKKIRSASLLLVNRTIEVYVLLR